MEKDVEKFGLDTCLEKVMEELNLLVTNGIFDEKSQTQLQIRIIACLGTVVIVRNVRRKHE